MNRARLGVDIGGTFTDLVAERAGRRWTAKLLTTPMAPERAVLDGIAQLLAAAGLVPRDIGLIVHGTTLATNALIERTGARTALLTTAGFRDIIELGTESRFEQYDLDLEKPEPLIARDWRLPIVERIGAGGQVLLPLDEASVLAAIDRVKAGSIGSVAVAFLHSHENPAHERRARAFLETHLPSVAVSLSSEVSPELREYERFTTTCANAYVLPLMAGYLQRLERALGDGDFDCPLYLMLSSGGITTIDTARRFPVRLVESGPAGGAIFARHIAATQGLARALSFDMGGTTAKICLIDDGVVQGTREFEVARAHRFRKGSGMPLRIPAIELVEIGAGGGSIARVDRVGRLGVGPESAGAEPGPACYGRGGAAATVTDADVLLGRIDPAAFAGGTLALDAERARRALAGLAQPGALALDADGFAQLVAELVDEQMASAARVHAVESGASLPERTLIAFGGAAPLHAVPVATKLGITRVLVPRDAGVGSSVGFLLAPVAYEVARSCYQRLSAFAPDRLNPVLAEMAAEARAVVERGAPGAPLDERRVGFARYVGQGHEIPVAVAACALAAGDAATLARAFETAYRAHYGRLIEGVDIEFLSWTVTVSIRPAPTARIDAPAPRDATTVVASRDVVDPASGTGRPTPIHRRAALAPGSAIVGPAIIGEDATSTVIPSGWHAMIDGAGTIVITREGTRA